MTRDEFNSLKPGDRISHSNFSGAMHATVIRHGELISFAWDDGTCSAWKLADKFDDEWVISTTLLPHEPTAKEKELAERVKVLERACAAQNDAICQTLGKALGLPRYCDDQANFPGATEADGVCVGDHTAESLAEEVAKRIKVLEGQRDELAESLEHTRYWYGCRLQRLDDLMRSEATEELRHRFFSIIANGTADIHEPPTYAQQMNSLRHQNERLTEWVGRLKVQRDGLVDGIKLALRHVPHTAECCVVRPTEQWDDSGSVSFEACNCDRRKLASILAQCTEGQAGGEGQ